MNPNPSVMPKHLLTGLITAARERGFRTRVAQVNKSMFYCSVRNIFTNSESCLWKIFSNTLLGLSS